MVIKIEYADGRDGVILPEMCLNAESLGCRSWSLMYLYRVPRGQSDSILMLAQLHAIMTMVCSCSYVAAVLVYCSSCIVLQINIA